MKKSTIIIYYQIMSTLPFIQKKSLYFGILYRNTKTLKIFHKFLYVHKNYSNTIQKETAPSLSKNELLSIRNQLG